MSRSKLGLGVWLGISLGFSVCVLLAFVISENWRTTHRDQVYGNAVAIYHAAEQWQIDSNGARPVSLSSRNHRGKTVLDYLPASQPLINPFTQRRITASDSTGAGSIRLQPGDSGIEVIGYGQGGRELLRLPRDHKGGGTSSL